MLILLAAIFALHILGVILLLVATIDNITSRQYRLARSWLASSPSWASSCSWPSSSPSTKERGSPSPASFSCSPVSYLCVCFTPVFFPGLYHSLSLSLSSLTALTDGLVVCFPPGLCIMIAASIYTDRFHIDEKDGWYGHCFILAWIAFALTFISSIVYFVLRKKTA
uniref:Uncharacterized protein n=1 Tax=Scophthalmus maximus TaxID=52904 RepID=A0A8D3CQC5_SCOMX